MIISLAATHPVRLRDRVLPLTERSRATGGLRLLCEISKQQRHLGHRVDFLLLRDLCQRRVPLSQLDMTSWMMTPRIGSWRFSRSADLSMGRFEVKNIPLGAVDAFRSLVALGKNQPVTRMRLSMNVANPINSSFENSGKL